MTNQEQRPDGTTGLKADEDSRPRYSTYRLRHEVRAATERLLVERDTLEAQNKRLREALEFYACDEDGCDCVKGKENASSVTCGFVARAAIKGEAS